MPSDTGKAPAFDGAGRGRLPIGKLRGHSPVWWKTPRAAGPSESAASTRSERKRPKAGPVPHATARFPAAAYGFRRRVDGFLRKAPGARCVPHPIPSAPEGTGGSHILKKDIPLNCSQHYTAPEQQPLGRDIKNGTYINDKRQIWHIGAPFVPPKRGERRPQTCGKFALCHGAPYGLQPFLQ